MSIVVYQDVATPIVPVEGLAGRVREALGASLRSMRYPTPDFAGLYQDAAGTTPVTAVGQPVGLMLDRRFGLTRGPELIPQPIDLAAPAWAKTGNVTESSGTVVRAVGAGTVSAGVLTVGKTYELRVSFLSSTALNTRIYNNASGTSNPIAATPGVLPNGTYIFTAVDTPIGIRLGGEGETVISSFSVREIPGNHASQTTTTARPTLLSGPLRIDYDGVDDYLRTVFPALGSNVTIARSIPGVGVQILTGQTIAAGNWDDNVDSCATLVIDRALTGPETALVTAFLNQQAGV